MVFDSMEKFMAKTPVHEGFSLALTRDDTPGETYAETKKDGITYFVDENDRWFFIGFDLKVDFVPDKDPEKCRLHLYSKWRT